MIVSAITHRVRRMRWIAPWTRFSRRAQRLFSVAIVLSMLLALWGSSATSASTPPGTGHLGFSSASIASLLLPAPSDSGVTDASTPLGTGFLDFSYSDPLSMTVSGPTGEKPESKLWWNDGFWWGSLYNNTVHAYHIYRLNWGTQTWEDTGTELDDRPDSKADTLWDDANANKKLYVVSHLFTTTPSHTTNTLNKGRLYRYSYDSATQSYSLDPGFPVNVNDDKTQALVLDKDTTGRLWTSYVSRPSGGTDYQVYVNATTASGLGNDASWPATAFSLGSLFPEAHVITDDLSSLVSFGTGVSGTIGIMWSNALSGTLNFATHLDSNSSYITTTDWSLTTVPIPTFVDKHINLKSLQASPDGQVFAAIKLTSSNPTDPQIGLVTRDTDGSLAFHTYSTKADNNTRPIVVLDTSVNPNRVYVFVTSSAKAGAICYKSLAITSPLSSMGDFSPPTGCGTSFIADATINRINNATTFKRVADANTGIVVLASDDLNGKFYVHATLGDPPPVVTARSPALNAPSVPVTSTVSVTFSKAMNQSTLTNANFTLTGSSGAVAGTRSYNAATRTWTFTPNSLLRANTTFTATISGNVQDTSGQTLFGGADTWSFTTEPPTVQFSSTNYSVSEAAGTATITVTLNVSSTTSVNVNYATSDGTATAPDDYSSASNTLTFSPGLTSRTFSVPINNDPTPEAVESVNLALSTPVNDVLGTPITATLSILDNDSPPTVQFDPAAFSVDESSGTANIAVGLSVAAGFPVTVTYTTSAGTATAGLDYTDTTGSLVFNTGETLKTFPVSIVNDLLNEPDETVHLALSDPISATLGTPDDQATLTIVDNDPQPTVQFDASGYSVNEADSTATITATLSAASGFTVTVGYDTSNFTALAGSDYITATGTLTFTSGVTATTFTVPILNDALNEANEIVNLALSNPNNATLGTTSAATLTIIDDDPQPTVQFSSSTYSWGENLGTVTITATLSAPSGQTVSVDYATSNGTATAGSDYTAVADTLVFAPGVTVQTFTVDILDDVAFEGNETVNLTLSNATHATLGAPGTAVLTILDNERIYLPLIMR